jgi:general secretion pathway protein G
MHKTRPAHKLLHLSLVQRGMTLIELLVVLVILGLIASLAGPQVMKYLGSAKTDTAKQQIHLFEGVLDGYKLDNARYPTTQEGLGALVAAPGGVTSWKGPYLKKNAIPKDPWGNDYIYASPGEQNRPYDIISYGADGKVGGENENKDVNSWE